MKEINHLYWAWRENPKLIIGISQGISLCNERGVFVRHLKLHQREVNCQACIKKAQSDDGLGRTP